jgi:rubrerythrin
MYKCPDCGYVSEEPGECPMCHIAMAEEEEEEN